jgi:probable HAF family extracellular repeat protein
MFGEEFTAVDINNGGTVVGHMRLTPSTDQACMVENGKLSMLPMYQGIHPWYAIGINDNGDVLGAGTLGTGTYHSIVYRGGKVIDIGVPGHPGFPGASALNNLTQVTGFIGSTPFIWDNGTITSIPGGGQALAINNTQTLVGWTASHDARMWRAGKYIDLHPNWAFDSQASSVNEIDEAVGYAWANTGGQHAVLWRDGKNIQLGNFGGGHSRAYDINNQSQVVGWATDPGGVSRGFFWDEGTMHQIENLIPGGSGFQILGRSFAVNNDGQILSIGFTGTANHELLLNPVPEPGTAIILIGLICAFTFSRRAKRRG